MHGNAMHGAVCNKCECFGLGQELQKGYSLPPSRSRALELEQATLLEGSSTLSSGVVPTRSTISQHDMAAEIPCQRAALRLAFEEWTPWRLEKIGHRMLKITTAAPAQ